HRALPAPERGPVAAARPFVEPRNAVERDLAAVWREILRVPRVGATDDFFELGGHSFLAAVLMARINGEFGQRLPLGALMAAPTVEKLAAVLLHELEAGSDRCLVRLHGAGPGAPVFLIAGVGGHVFTFNRFARLLGDGRPVYGVKAIGVDGSRRPPERVEEIAAEYKREILELGRPGPVTLCGYSVGALTA